MSTPIERLVDQALIDSLPPGLRAAIDDLLARGASPAAVLDRVTASAAGGAGGDPNKGKLTVAAVEAYLASLDRGRPGREGGGV